MQNKKVGTMSVAVFRPAEYIDETVEKFSKEGFNVVAVPFLKTVVSQEGIERLKKADFSTAIITSQTAAKIVLENIGLDGKRVIAIGKRTAGMLEKAGINAEIPSKFDSESIVREFAEKVEGRVVIMRSNKGDPVLLKIAEYADVEEIVLYTIQEEHGREQLDVLKKIADGEVDAVVFSSRMMVRSFMELAEKEGLLEKIRMALSRITVVAIGPPTAKALESYGIKALMPEEYSFDGVIALLKSSESNKFICAK